MIVHSRSVKVFVTLCLGLALALSNAHIVNAQDEVQDQSFCNKVNTYQNEFEEKLTQSTKNFSSTLSQQQRAMEESIAKRDRLLKSNRDKWNTIRQTHYTKMIEQAQSENQKKAIEMYRDKVEAAVVTERNTIDTVHKNYQSSIMLFISTRDGKAQSLAQEYSTTVRAAYEAANKTCQAGANATDTRSQLKRDIQNANQMLLLSQTGINATGQALTKMAIEQQQRLTSSKLQFQTTLQAASRELQAQQ